MSEDEIIGHPRLSCMAGSAFDPYLKIYEANIGEIKALHKNEIEAVFQFYSGIEHLRDRVSPYEIADPEYIFGRRDEGLRALEELRRKPQHRFLRQLGFYRSEDAYET